MKMNWDVKIPDVWLVSALADDAKLNRTRNQWIARYPSPAEMANYLAWKTDKSLSTVYRGIRSLTKAQLITVSGHAPIVVTIDLSNAEQKPKYSGALPLPPTPPAPSIPLPEWFAPLTTLAGYRSGSHIAAIAKIEAGCADQEVDPQAVIESFARYYATHRVMHHWYNPVAVLAKTLKVQISKVASRPAQYAPDYAAMRQALNERLTGDK